MESDLQYQHHFLQGHYQPQKQMNSGLTRYQSAPSTYFSSILDRDFCEDFLTKPSSPETERILTRFLASSEGNTGNTPHHQNLRKVKEEPPVKDSMMTPQVNQQNQILGSMNNTTGKDTTLQQQQRQQQQQSNYSASSQSFYQSQSKPPLPDHSSGSGTDYRGMTSKGMDRLPQMKTGGGGNSSNLVRHSSSPAGLFANINIEFENGYAVIKNVGDFGAANQDTSYPSAAATRPPSGQMTPIAENIQDKGGFREAHSSNYVADYSMGSWDDSTMMSADTKGLTDEDRTLSGVDESEIQDVAEARHPAPMLSHHLSLPKTSAEISAIEKFLHLQDSVPCKIRAKRGCATHPRSIAERVRRTRISERMRKLQELVPNMDKQTNTADMLDLAVDYIKELQRQVKTLTDNRAKCTCSKQ
ncbi:hypothetical protein Tsubulata_006959 [Turnera subulata]|uniref:BHLH domain-containing protein n=1 Tax=Turnera subulata TaxID=218843 RepID=A0A9Q0GBX9_9ROSI|nr:hypothetical protein Tsubulata_006959 [Turnera subulata]